MRRRRSFVERRLRSLLTGFVRENLLPIGMLLGVYAVAVAVGLLLGGRGYWQGFSNGFMLAAMIAVFLLLFLLHTGGVNQVAGAYGERRTREELEVARRTGLVWSSVHNVELPDGDIDFVVFGPSGVLALEAKWRMQALDRRWLGRDLAQAERGAAKTRALLRSKTIDAGVHEVTPVLVVWGKAALDIPDDGELMDGVWIIDGNQFRSWLGSRSQDANLPRERAVAACESLRRFAAGTSEVARP